MKRPTRNEEMWVMAVVGLLGSQLVAADGAVVVTTTQPPRIEIDLAPFKIDLAAGLREIEASLRKAVVIHEDTKEPVQVAIAEGRTRG
jgi:hypothetical protein